MRVWSRCLVCSFLGFVPAAISEPEPVVDREVVRGEADTLLLGEMWNVVDEHRNWQRRAARAAELGVSLAGGKRSSEESLSRLDRLTAYLPRESGRRRVLERKWRRLRRELLEGRASAAPEGLALEFEARPVRPASDCGEAGAAPLKVGEGPVSWVAAESDESWFLLEGVPLEPALLMTVGSAADTHLTVYEACNGKVVASNDDGSGLWSMVTAALPFTGSAWVRITRLAGRAGAPMRLVAEGGDSGVLTGSVVEEGSGAPLPFVSVVALTSLGFFAGSDWTDSAGIYEIEGLEDGSYYLLTEFTDEYVDELWDDHPCDPICDPLTGDLVAVTQTIPGVANFELSPGGMASGVILETGGGPLASDVRLEDADGFISEFASTDAAGRFTFTGLPTGTYFVYTRSFEGFRDEVFDDIPCVDFCDPQSGTPIAVTQGVETTGIDFSLDRLGTLAGRVVQSSTGQPIPFANLRVVSAADGGSSDFPDADVGGYWRSRGLEPGTYFVATSESDVYRNEVFDGVPCGTSCDPQSGTPISLGIDEEVGGIDFALERLGWLSGRVSDAASGAAVLDIDVELWLDDSTFVDWTQPFSSGYFEVTDLHPDSYLVVTAESETHIDEAWDGVPCPFGPFDGCLPSDGSPVAVALAAGTGGIDFELDLGGSVTGRVSDEFLGEGLEGVGAALTDSAGVQRRYSDLSDGRIGFFGLPAGDYRVFSDTFTHLNEVWDDIPCGSICDPLAGDPIAVSLGEETAGIDLALALEGGLRGTITNALGEPVEGVILHVWTDDGQIVAAGASDENGRYQVDLESGVYYVSTENSLGVPEELWDDIPCPGGPASQGGCDPTTGDPVTVVGAQAAVAGIDFELGSTIFADGFESGDTSAWSVTVP